MPADNVNTPLFLPPRVSARKLVSWLMGLLLTVNSALASATGGPGWQRDPVLSPLLIQQMVTDAAGYRWVATDEGVYRYDGNELVPLKSLVRQGPRLAVAAVAALALDQVGRLWIGAESGLLRFDPGTGRLLLVPLPVRPDERPKVATLLYHPRSDRLWVGYGAGTIAVFAATRPQAPLFPVSRVAETAFYFTAETGGDGVWLASDRPVLYYLAPNGTVQRQFRVPAQLLPVPGTRPQRFFGRQGMFVLDPAYRLRALCRWPRLLPQMYHSPYVTDSTLDALVQGQWLHVSDLRGACPRLSSTPVTGVANQALSYRLERDAQGIWWRYARDWRGCYKQRPVRRVVEPVLRAGGEAVGSARLIARLPDGRLFVSTYGGSFTQAADSPAAPLRPFRSWQVATHEKYDGVFGGIFAPPTGHFAVLADELWGVLRLDLTMGQISNLAQGPLRPWRRETPGPARAFALLHDHAGRLWVGGQTGLFRVSADLASLRRVADDQPDWPLHKLDITGLAEDPATGALWISTTGGLFWLPPDQPARLRAYGVEAPAGHRLPTDALTCVTAAGPGRVWVGTLDQGLLLVDAHAGVVRQLSEAEGLPSHRIATILPDRAGHLWVGTYAGLVRYAPASGQLSVFGETEGFKDPELNRRSAFADADGTLWFGGVSGVYRVRPERAVAIALPRPPRLLLTALGTPAGATEAVRYLPAGHHEQFTLPAGPNAFVELRLALTDYFDPDLARYAYRLHYAAEARPTAWLNTPRRLVLRGLAPGNYEVEIRAETAGGQPAGNHLRVPLHVEASWWQWPLLWALVAGGLLALGYGTHRLRLRSVLREAHRRVELAANLHDEVGALLTRVTMLAEVLREHYLPGPGEALAGRFDPRQAFDRLLYNSRAAVQTMRDVVWGIDSQADSVAALLDRMREHLDQTATAAGLHATFTQAGLSEATVLPASTRQHLFLIFKEAVTNAARHAQAATEISVQLGRRQGKLVLEVCDNGQSSASSLPHPSGMGLRNMAHRAKALGADLRTGPHQDGRPGYCVLVTLG
ncbi:two-component regulator propeller domain-containing protein [Hymenobacter sp. H14-R3]|uniref:sensor histidine kinase n=1 Tax=Hymenobacter sp. H14-R3 TaxID=3046308 RepID=UPI0024BA6EC3|nr:two-component regulator propeller domain-containing protein [Hymenobacter sp. H14-R3]MDJ0366500.1 two-component regulator propeller domain-containing protein [Hymenobacter sp. H14-R3]